MHVDLRSKVLDAVDKIANQGVPYVQVESGQFSADAVVDAILEHCREHGLIITSENVFISFHAQVGGAALARIEVIDG